MMKRLCGAALFAALVFVFSVAGIACDEVIREKNAYLSELEDKIAFGEAQNDKIRLTAAEISSPRNLERIAESELGMVRAEENDRVLFAEDKALPLEKNDDFEGGGIFAAAERLRLR